MNPPRWLPAGLACVAVFVSGCVVMVPAHPEPPVVMLPRPTVVITPPPVVITPRRQIYLAPPAIPSPYRPPRCYRTPLGHCEVHR